MARIVAGPSGGMISRLSLLTNLANRADLGIT
jgi:hypothetical protein